MTYSLQALTTALFDLIAHTYNLDPTTINKSGIAVTMIDGTQSNRGDLATNAAMVLVRKLKQAPRLIADTLCQRIISCKEDESSPLHAIAKVEVAGPGFINITLTSAAWSAMAEQLATDAATFVKNEHINTPQSYLIEFVSANPTGPLHLGHGRNGIVGDVLKRILSFCGHEVFTEFYINDAGVQMGKLGNSLMIRCQQETGQEVELPEDGYCGTYLVDLAKQCINEYGADVVAYKEQFFTDYAHQKLLAEQKQDLADYRITFDRWFSEQTLHNDGAVERALQSLADKGFLYEKEDALWFKATEFGDDKDRVIRKQDGSLTYIAADIAYHIDKFSRNTTHPLTLVNILGQDHHGYVQRLKGTMKALGYNTDQLSVILTQLVSLKKGLMPVKMSKRAGTFTSLRDIIDTVGVDAARFFFLHKKVEAHLEFDIETALKKSQENPVFYLQYAFVRTNSLIEKAKEADIAVPNAVDYDGFIFDEAELAVIKKALSLNQVLASIEHSHATHLLANYALELAQTFHVFYTNNKIIDPSRMEASQRRLALVKVVQETLGLVLDLLGLQRLERM